MRALLAFLVLAVLCLLLFVWPGSSEPVQGNAVSDGKAASAPPSPTTGASAANAEPTAAAIPERQAVDQASDAPSCNLRVVLFGTDTPVAGATVRSQSPGFEWQKLTTEQQRELQELRDPEESLRRTGNETVTDADGRCRVLLNRAGTEVIARSGDLYGARYLGRDQRDEVQVAVRTDRTLRVLVLDDRGQPGGSVRLGVNRSPADKNAAPELFAWTDTQGRYEQRHSQTLAGKEATAIVDLFAVPPGGAGTAVSVDVAAPPPEVVLRLGPTGTVTVRVLDAAGQPIDPQYLANPVVSLAGFEKRPENSNQEDDGFNRQQAQVRIDVRGFANFANVAMDRYLLVRRDWSGVPMGFTGPTNANPRVDVTLQEADGAVFQGTLLDADGSPLANGEYYLAARTERGSSSGQAIRTDDRGRIRCYLHTYAVGERVIVTVGTPQRQRENKLSVELPPRKVQAGSNDLGEVRLAPPALILAGRLVLEGEVKAATVPLQLLRRQGQIWEQESLHRFEWQDGAFTLRGGIPRGEPLRLEVHEGDWLPVAPIECRSGDTGIEIRLRQAGSATAVFLVDDLTPVDRLQFQLLPDPPLASSDARLGPRQLQFEGGTQPRNGQVQRTWRGLLPGKYDLTVKCAGVTDPVVRVAGIAVTAGPCPDPRLSSIDLRGRVNTFEVRATSTDGQPIASTEAFVIVCGKEGYWLGYHLGRGVATIATPNTVDLCVVAPGYRMATAESVGSSRTVPLERAETATLRVELPQPLPEGVEFRLRLKPSLGLPERGHIILDTPAGMTLDDFFLQEAVVGADGSASLLVRVPGEHSIGGKLLTGRKSSHLGGFTPAKATLSASVTTVKVDAKELDSALQRLRQ